MTLSDIISFLHTVHIPDADNLNYMLCNSSCNTPQKNYPHRVKCHKIITIYPQPVRRHYHPKYTLITLALVSYLRSLVVRAVHRRHRAQAWIRFLPEDLIVDEFFSTVPGKNFDLCIISTRTKTHLFFF